jgi:hypothetical protein
MREGVPAVGSHGVQRRVFGQRIRGRVAGGAAEAGGGNANSSRFGSVPSFLANPPNSPLPQPLDEVTRGLLGLYVCSTGAVLASCVGSSSFVPPAKMGPLDPALIRGAGKSKNDFLEARKKREGSRAGPPRDAMPFVLLRYDNKYRHFTLEAPVNLTRKLAKVLEKINFQMKFDDETRLTGDLARTGCTLREVLNAIETQGWNLFQASTGGHTAGKMGNELYVFKGSGGVGTDSEVKTQTGMLMPPPAIPKAAGEVKPEASAGVGAGAKRQRVDGDSES